jgi:hypothetical protein
MKVPAYWFSSTGGKIDDVEINAFFSGQGYTVLQRTRGGRFWEFGLAEDLDGPAKTALESIVKSKLNEIKWEGGS